jgi:hypothetical protein
LDFYDLGKKRMGKNEKRSKARKDKAERLDANYDANRLNNSAESENEDADTRIVTVSLIELRNIINNEVKNQLTDFNESIAGLIDELRGDLALRFDCIDNQLNEAQINSKSAKEDLENIIDNMKLNFVKLEEKVAKSIHTTRTTAEKLNCVSNTAPIATMAQTIAQDNQLKSTIEEFKEKEEKKSNVIIFNVLESNAANVTDRKNADIIVYKDICKSIDIEEHNILNIFRIGSKIEGKIRPLVVKSNEYIRTQIIKNAHKMRDVRADVCFKRAVLKPDLTKTEQIEEKALIVDLKRRRGLGEKVFIRRGKIETSKY